jgi:hypothetical protein
MIIKKIRQCDRIIFYINLVNNPVNNPVNNLEKTVYKKGTPTYSQMLSTYSQHYSQSQLLDSLRKIGNIEVINMLTAP